MAHATASSTSRAPCCCSGASTSGRSVAPRVAPPQARRTAAASLARHVGTPSVLARPQLSWSSVSEGLTSLLESLYKQGSAAAGGGKRYSILGWGQGIVDMTCDVSKEDLEHLGLKGLGRRVISVEERAEAMGYLSGRDSLISAGGSVANSLVGFSRLAGATGADALPVCFTGYVGSDPLGQFFSSQMRQAGVRVLPDGPDGKPQGYTGTVMVLSEPDAQRSFLVLPPNGRLTVPSHMKTAIAQSQVLVVEGYLWEAPGALEAILEAVDAAVASGTRVAMTAGDPSVVTRHREGMLKVLATGKVDMLFSNLQEARVLAGPLLGQQPQQQEGEEELTAEVLARALGNFCPVAVVTDGAKGSCVSAMGQVAHQPAALARHGVVDTCGAGDAFAAGVLFGLAAFDFSPRFAEDAGCVGALAAATVIGHHGAELSEDDAEELADSLPAMQLPMLLHASMI